MKALITGASSGIGKDMAKYLDCMDYELILVGRNLNSLKCLEKEIKNKCTIIECDLCIKKDIQKVCDIIKNEKIDVLINNAGFGDCGYFSETSLGKELKMIDTNIKAMHILFKETIKMMEDRNSGYILNTSSFSAFAPGPLMATYYATKAYVLRISEAIHYEEKMKNKNVHISILCPGPIKTNFENVANVEFKIKEFESKYVAKYAINKMFKNKLVIVPGLSMKFTRLFMNIIPNKILMFLLSNIQVKRSK